MYEVPLFYEQVAKRIANIIDIKNSKEIEFDFFAVFFVCTLSVEAHRFKAKPHAKSVAMFKMRMKD